MQHGKKNLHAELLYLVIKKHETKANATEIKTLLLSLIYSLQHYTQVELKVESLIYSPVYSFPQQNLGLLPNIGTLFRSVFFVSLSMLSVGKLSWWIQLYTFLKERRCGSRVLGEETAWWLVCNLHPTRNMSNGVNEMNYKADQNTRYRRNLNDRFRDARGGIPTECLSRNTNNTEHQIPNVANCPCEAAGEGSRVRGYWIQSDEHGRGNWTRAGRAFGQYTDTLH